MSDNKKSKSSETVKVAIRCRPLSKKEVEQDFKQIVRMDSTVGRVTIDDASVDGGSRDFTFDAVFDNNCTQKAIYDETAYTIVESVLEGYNGTIFAYGQTGTGKTYTMVGADGDNIGIIPRAFSHIFHHINATPDRHFMVSASFLEIYNEQIRDLLGKDTKQKLDLKENPERGTYVKSLTQYTVKNEKELQKLMDKGHTNRAVAATNMNSESSRSHSLFTITVESQMVGPDGKAHIRQGKLNMVDLAGSERQSKTGATGETLKEATNINKSLSALGAVINALVDGKSSHIPYRDSKLTHLLKDSLGGNTKTVMVANLGPAEYNLEETLATLRYANRAKNIKNKPRINEDPKDTMIREFQEEISRLQAQLASGGGGGGSGSSGSGVMSEEQRREIEEEKERELRAKFDAERKKVEADKEKTEAEKEKILNDLKRKEEEAETQKKAEAKLVKKLQEMEAKVLKGRETEQKALQVEKDLRKAKEKLDAKKREEARMKAEQEKVERERADLEKMCSSKEDVIQKLYAEKENFKQKVKELEERQEIMEDERREVFEQSKTFGLYQLIVDHFIPSDELERFNQRAYWDDVTQQWKLHHIALSGNSLRMRKPKSAFGGAVHPMSMAAMEQLPTVPMYRQTNICQMELDLPEGTVVAAEIEDLQQMYQGSLPPAVVHAVESVLKPTNISIPDTQPQVYYNYGSDGLSKAGPEPWVGAYAGQHVVTNNGAGGGQNRPISAARGTAY